MTIDLYSQNVHWPHWTYIRFEFAHEIPPRNWHITHFNFDDFGVLTFLLSTSDGGSLAFLEFDAAGTAF